jgi:hypothetical protein
MQADEKLEAAFYFLDEMRKSTENRKVFIFNLDAFLSTSRSVTLVLQKEFGHDPKFRKWHSQKREEMKKDELMGFFIKQRNFSIKERSPETQVVTEVFITEVASARAFPSMIRPNGTEETFEPKPPIVESKPQATKNNAIVLHTYFFVGRTDNDVIMLCLEYCRKLFRLIAEAKTVLAINTTDDFLQQ